MLKLVLDENPIIFPKLTYQLGMLGIQVRINGKKRADFKLSEYLFEGVTGQELPVISIYDLKSSKWIEYFDTTLKYEIHPKIGNCYSFYDCDISRIYNSSLIENFIILHSSATIKCAI